jgi:small subunit ribosomal protein S8
MVPSRRREQHASRAELFSRRQLKSPRDESSVPVERNPLGKRILEQTLRQKEKVLQAATKFKGGNDNMTTSDPIADMLTRIRNANTAKHDTVDIPASKMKISIAEILFKEGYITKYEIIEDGNFKAIRITLKYGKDKNEKIITGLKRISKPGLRVYAGREEIPRVLGGLGIAILSTNQGVVTDKEARKLSVGGEVLAYVW